ncbi:MAG: ATP-binding protein [Owenweeksia sp.]|nr:ATP-binding protein [Owenweeksia sp.]
MDQSIPDYCYGDADRLRQITNNILGNAVKFTPKGNIKMAVQARHNIDGRLNLILKISDTGVGISDHKMSSIFESFNQQQMNDKRQFGGLGLGLSIVKKLVELHHGDINIESTPEVGTTVQVSLSYEKVPVEKQPTHDYSLEEKDLRGARVLVVEDNAINQLIMRKLLSSWHNTEFSIVENGQEALNILEKEVFDIILMDLQMPIMDGYEATHAIRAGQPSAEVKNIPIIAVTADTMEETKEKVFGIGINDYLSKPVKAETLFEKIALLLSRKAS